MQDENPASLTDEELQQRINGEEPAPEAPPANPAPEENPQPEPPAPEPNPAPEPPAPEGPAPEAPQPEVAPEPPVSRREQLRINQLLKRYGAPEEQPQPQRQAPQQQPQQQPGINYRDLIEADDDIYADLEAASQQYGDSRYQAGAQDILKQAQGIEWRTMLNIDAPVVEGKYEFLNPRDEGNFHPALADTLSTWYLNMSGYDPATNTAANPNMRYGDFVDGIMELAEEIAATRTARTTQNIAQQAATTALRPDGSSPTRFDFNKAPEHMSDDELKAFLKSQNL
jgi:hypothetical protein